MDTPETITSAEAAQRLGVITTTVSKLVRRGALTPVKKLPGIRGAYLFDPSDVDALAAARSTDR